MKIKTFLKKLLSLGLCLLLTLTTLSGAALAVETFTTSDAGVAMIEELEGYRQMPYVGTNGKWYVGYGLECDPSDYPAGISTEEAERLLREHLIQDEAWVNGFLIQYGISVTQYQFDALVSLTYTLGTQWINPSYRLCAYLINGIGNYSEAQVVNAMATWCHSGGNEIMENLVNRRLREAYLFLYGLYENDGPMRYCYIDYEPNGGTRDPSQDSRTIFYPTGGVYGALPVPTRAGYTFDGWYTADGTQLTGEEIAMGSLYVYARWSEGGGAAPVTPTVPSEQKPDYSTWVSPYGDVKEADWYYTYVRELSYHGIVSGYPDGTFRPNSELTAGEALKLLLVAATKTDPGTAASGHWAGSYLALAESLGCVIPGEIVDLDAPIDRLSIASIAAIALGLQPVTGPTPFADVDNGYTLALYEAGIITGDTSGSQRFYNPGGRITRAEMCTIVSRIRGYETPNDPALSGYVEYESGNKRVPVLWNVPAAPYNKDLFVRDGSWMYYNDPAYTTAIGIDVSSHQKDIDWQKVADSGIEFAIIRVGGRGWGTEGKTYLDEQFEKNLTGAQAAGLRTGVYFFSTATSAEEAMEEAGIVLTALAGRALEYPVVYDWEISNREARNANLDVSVATDSAIAFCETIALAGYTPMIYLGLDTAYSRLDLSRLTAYDKWFAQYTSKNQPDMYYDYRIWQYTSSGSVPGIEGKVDMDIAFLPY